MLVLILKVLGPFLALVPTACRAWSEWRAAARVPTGQLVWSAVLAGLTAALLAADHMTSDDTLDATRRSEAAAVRGEAAANAALKEQTAFAEEAREDAEEAQQVRQRLEESVAKLASTLGLDPGLTVHQKLDLIGEQLRGMRGRTTELEDQLTGLRKYGDVAKLNIWGKPGIYGDNINYSSDLSRAIEGAWGEGDGGGPIALCDQAALDKFSDVAERFPAFPFAHLALADCATKAGAGVDIWCLHTERGIEILRHTTQIAGHHPSHTELYGNLQKRLALENPCG